MLPVVGRELLVSARRPASYWTRSGFVALLLLLMTLITAGSSTTTRAGNEGMMVFAAAAGLLLIYALISGAMLTADCLSSERREGTLPLLFLTDLKAVNVVLGKLICSSVQGFYFFLSVIPALCLGFLFGGIEWRLVFLTLAVLLSTLVVSLELGVYVSSRSQVERKAILGTLLAVGIWALGPLLLEDILTGRSILEAVANPQLDAIALISPLTQFAAANTSGVPVAKSILVSIAVSQALGLFFLRRASRRLSTSKTGEETPRSRGRSPKASRSERQRVYRSKLLDHAPTMWLTARERWKPQVAVLFTVTILLVIAGLWLLDTNADGRLAMLVGGIWAIGIFFKIWVLMEACQRSFEDRQSGALELLLTTPLPVREMAAGFHRALRSWFRIALVLPFFCLGLFLVLSASSLGSERLRDSLSMFFPIVMVGIVDLWALSWIGLWQASRSRSTLRATVRAVAVVFGIPVIVFITLTVFARFVSFFQSGSDWVEWILFSIYFGLSLLCSILAGRRAKRLYLHSLREVAAARFESRQQARRLSFRVWVASIFTFRKRSPKAAGSWLKSHPVWGSLLIVLLVGILLQAVHIHNLDQQVNRRIQDLKASGWTSDYSVFAEMRAKQTSNKWVEGSPRLRDSQASYEGFQRRDAFDAGFEPMVIPDPLAPLSTNHLRLIRPHLAKNLGYFKSLHSALEADWIDLSASDAMNVNTWQYWRSFGLRSIDLRMLTWKGLVALEDRDTTAAVDSVEQLLRFCRLCLRTHRSLGLQPARTSCVQAAKLTERILANTTPDKRLLRRLSGIWDLGEEAANIEPELRRCFAMLAGGWESPDSLQSKIRYRESGLGSFAASVYLGAEHAVGRHQHSMLYALQTITNAVYWDRQLVADQSADFDFNQVGSMAVTVAGFPYELAGVVNIRREILGQARAMRMGLALMGEQLARPAAGKAAWLGALTNQPSLVAFAPDFEYHWETNGFTLRKRGGHTSWNLPPGNADHRSDLRFELRRRDWIEPAP